MTVTITTFIIVMILMTSAGAMSIVRKKKTPQDYLIASRSVAPWLSALSTVATNNSGFIVPAMGLKPSPSGDTFRFYPAGLDCAA